MQRRRIGDRVHPVEGVWEIDEPALLSDRRDRVRERQPARDLPFEEQADHFALAVGLHLFAWNDDQVAVARELGRCKRSADHVVVGDGDRAEADPVRIADEVGGVDRAIVRPARVHVQVAQDPVPIHERVGRARRPTAPARERPVDLVEPPRDRREALALRARARRLLAPRAEPLVLAQPGHLRARELGLRRDARRRRDRATCGSGLERHARKPAGHRDEDRGFAEDGSPRTPVPRRADTDALP